MGWSVPGKRGRARAPSSALRAPSPRGGEGDGVLRDVAEIASCSSFLRCRSPLAGPARLMSGAMKPSSRATLTYGATSAMPAAHDGPRATDHGQEHPGSTGRLELGRVDREILCGGVVGF